jgi:predicted CXXCH cytochrome family protein
MMTQNNWVECLILSPVSATKISFRIILKVFIFIVVLIMSADTTSGAEIDCLACHEALTQEKFVHPAVSMGCVLCHSAIDASAIPHKKNNKVTSGLSSEQPELCFGCHDASRFTGKTVHAAVRKGCTGCHNPHSSKNAKLLLSEQPELCYACHNKIKFTGKFMHVPVVIGMCTECHAAHQSENEKLLLNEPPALCYKCHDAAEFGKQNVHAPVAGGMCLSCHDPHASKNEILLRREPTEVCLDCHREVREKSHVVSGGHPVGIARKDGKLDDPLRTGKRFYCGSCHNPHSSDSVRLFRYEVKSTFELCMKCHNK